MSLISIQNAAGAVDGVYSRSTLGTTVERSKEIYMRISMLISVQTIKDKRMSAISFFHKVSEMRELQKQYFKTRDKGILAQSKMAEKDVDTAIEAANTAIQNGLMVNDPDLKISLQVPHKPRMEGYKLKADVLLVELYDGTFKVCKYDPNLSTATDSDGNSWDLFNGDLVGLTVIK